MDCVLGMGLGWNAMTLHCDEGLVAMAASDTTTGAELTETQEHRRGDATAQKLGTKRPQTWTQ